MVEPWRVSATAKDLTYFLVVVSFDDRAASRLSISGTL